ncbi:hypothetical protein [Actinospica sp.]|uniref:hypothetical protein n=1 Tax=Actinospica sp. TaxID=1872142 RepID=UPI0039C87FCB
MFVAAAYEFTPLKTKCRGKCRSPFGFSHQLLARWTLRGVLDGRSPRGAWAAVGRGWWRCLRSAR